MSCQKKQEEEDTGERPAGRESIRDKNVSERAI